MFLYGLFSHSYHAGCFLLLLIFRDHCYRHCCHAVDDDDDGEYDDDDDKSGGDGGGDDVSGCKVILREPIRGVQGN